jgi:hypothetical protein
MAACRIIPGAPCTVAHSNTPVALVLANAVNGTKIVSAGIQLQAGPWRPINPSADGQSIQITVDTLGLNLVTVTLNQVQPKDPTYSVSLEEKCDAKTDIIYFRDPISRTGQVELQVQ